MRVFNYYAQGMLRGALYIDSAKEFFCERDWTTGRMSPETEIGHIRAKMRTAAPLLPIEAFAEKLGQLECADWTSENVTVADSHYMRGARYSGEGYTVWVFAESTASDGVLDILISENHVIGCIFTCGYAAEYLIEPGWEGLTPFAEWDKLKGRGCGVFALEPCNIYTPDGEFLSTRVYLPANCWQEERFPVILTRTSYGAAELGLREGAAADRGYAVVVQDVRGRGESSGQFLAGYYEKRDAAATIAWIKAQSWFGGAIGVIGGSYLGYTAWAAMAVGGADIKAAVSLVTSGSPFYGDSDRKNGAYSASDMLWHIKMSAGGSDAEPPEKDWAAGLKHLPIGDIPKFMTGRPAFIWDTYLAHPDFDDFWREIGIAQHAEQIDVPTLYVTGYHEGCHGTMEMWNMNERKARGDQYLILGPWYHNFNGNRTLPGQQLSVDAVLYNMDLLYAQWFDRWLKNTEPAAMSMPRITQYIEGKNQWRHTGSFNEGALKQVFHLADGGRLLIKPQRSTGCNLYDYDPDDAPPQLSIEDQHLVAVDYSYLDKRPDVLTYTTDAFRGECALVGAPRIEFWASSSARDTDFVARLTRVTEDGASLYLCSQIVRAKYRDSFEEPSLLVPGRPYRFQLELPWVGCTMVPGERLRLSICSAAQGDFFPNRNTGEDPRFDTGKVKAHQTVYHGGEMDSSLVLYLLEQADEM